MPDYLKGIFNKLVLAIIIGATLFVPTYAGILMGFTLGHRHMTEIQRQQPASIFTYLQSPCLHR